MSGRDKDGQRDGDRREAGGALNGLENTHFHSSICFENSGPLDDFDAVRARHNGHLREAYE